MATMTLGELRRLTNEAARDEELPEHDGIQVGHDYTDRRGRTGKVTRLYVHDFGPDLGSAVMVRQSFGGHSTEQRFDAWLRAGWRPATPDEAADAATADEADRSHQARHVDTGREGT